MVGRPSIDHVTTIVGDLGSATSALQRVLGCSARTEDRIPDILVSTFGLGNAEVHLVSPRSPGPVADFLARGGGLHHLALRFDELEGVLEEMRRLGIRTMGAPVEMLPGVREVFLDPKFTGGLLVQLVERRGEGVIER